MPDAAAVHRQLNASLPQYIENHIATGAFLVGTLHRKDIKLDNSRELGDFFVSLSLPDTLLMYKVTSKDAPSVIDGL